jgi:uncharacterized protein YebE (UPF0316 family)
MTELFAGPWGPLLIFGLRIVDVSLATLRMLLTMRNRRRVVPFIGFVESLIWVFAVGTAIRNLQSPWHLLGYSGGFAAGTVTGLWLEGKLALGVATVRIICRDYERGERLADILRTQGFGVTEFAGEGREGRVGVIYTVVTRRQIPAIIREAETLDPSAFISVEEPRAIHRGWMFPVRRK